MADDIKIKLGLDAAELFNGLNKVTTELNQVQNESKQTDQALDKMADINTSSAVADVNKLSAAIDGVGDSASGISGVFQGLKGGLNDAFSGGLIGSLIGGGLAGGIQAGLGAVADGFGAIIDGGRELVAAQGNLQAATGASGEEFEALKASAEDAFIGGVGGSLAEATKAIANAKASLQDALPNDQIGEFVKNAQALGTLYDKDVNEVVSKSAPFVRQFGLEGQEAFNLIAFAAKEGKTSQDDVLDTIAEYSGLLQEAGFSAEEFAAQIAVAGQEGLFTTDKIGDSIKEAQIRLKAGDTAKAIADIQGSLPKAMGATLKELEGLATSGQISIKEFLERSGGAIEEAFSAGDISEAMRSQLQVAIAGTPAEDLGAEAYARMFGAPIPKEEIAAKALQAGKEAQNAAGQYLTFDAFSKKLELAFQQASQSIVLALDGVFKTLTPIIDFVSANLGTIATVVGTIAAAFAGYNIVVGISTAATAAYAAVQTALGGSISIATVAQYAWNLAMSLNPIGAVVAALAVLGAGIYAITDALSVSAEETREQAEANVSLIETQKKANEEQTTMTKGTKSMADEFIKLSEKKKLTNAETARMKQLTGDLSKEYPDLVKNTGSYKDNLDGVEAIAKRAGTSLDNLAQESSKLDKALQSANQTLSYSKRNQALDEAASQMKTLGVVTDKYGLTAVNAFSKALYAAKTQEQAADAYNTAIKNISNVDAQTAVTTAYNSQIAAMNAFKKTADTVVEVNKKLDDTTKPPPKGDPKPSGTPAESEYKKALARYQSYLSGIEIYRKEQINKFDAQGLNKEEIQLKLSEDPNAAPTAEALTKTIENTFGTTRDAQGNLVLGVKLGKDENLAEATLNVRKLLTEVGKFEVRINTKAPDFKDTLKEFDTLAKDIAKNSESLVPTVLATSQEALDASIATVQQYIDFIKLQNDEIALKQAEAIAAGNQEAADKFGESIQTNIQNINLLSSRLDRFGTESKTAIEKAARESTLEFQIQTALQTSILDAFNSEKIRKEKEANDAIREERLGALNAEEDDLTKSLAKREISFEDYAAKIADIDAQRKQVEEQTEVTFLQRLKGAGDQAAASIFKSQSEIFKKNAQGMEGNQKVFNEFVGQTLEQFGTLAASGKATLADFGNAAAGAAFDAVSKMIPSFVVGILGSSITTLGPIAGPLIAATLTAGLQLLLANARGALGFKDGVVGLEGPGTERSDSIPAWLSKGESVITAAGTKANRQELEWMNNNPGMSIKDYFTSNAPQVRYSVQEDGNLIQEVRKLREETRGLGKQINRNTHVEISGALVADNNSIKAVIERDRRRNARRG
jgi:phage-related minor tail protein/cupin superfamily acireductone dioxygenase involved in methionine salvage